MIKKFAAIVLLCWWGNTITQGQNYTPEDRYLQSRIEQREIDRNRWAQLTEGIDYSEKTKKTQRNRSISDNNTGASTLPLFGEGVGSAVARFLLITLGAILIALLVRSMLGYGQVKNKKIKRESEGINIQKIEENLHKADLVDYIQRAKNAGDFNLAIRLYYLSVLKELSLQKVIKWKLDKTNSEYLREMHTKPHFSDFRALTLIFEQSWYGGRTLDGPAFAQLEPHFRRFIDQLLPTAQAEIV